MASQNAIDLGLPADGSQEPQPTHVPVDPVPEYHDDMEIDDHDSTYGGDDLASETTSLRSSIFNHVYENGRRYNSYRNGAYW